MAAKLALRVREMRQPATEEGVGALAREIWSEVVRLSGREVLKCALAMEGRPFDPGNGEGEDLLDTVCRGRGQMGLANIAISPSVPVIAVGGPVKVYYGEVARRLKAEVIFPDFCDVANAVGAATGVIARTSLVHVVSDGGGIFRIHGAHGTEVLNSPEEALRRAEHLAKEAARSAALAMGSEEPKVSVTVDKHLLPEAVDDRGLFSAKVAAEAVGRPLFGTSPAKLR